MMLLSCAKNDESITAFTQDMMVEIIAGPGAAGVVTISNNANFTFEWRALGAGSNVSFDVQLSGVDASPINTNETSKSYPGQPEGSYTFTVTAKSGSKTANDHVDFNVGANIGSPQVVISGARGSASTGGSGETPVYAPGQTAFFHWTSEDPDRFGQITGFRWKIADSESFNDFSLASVAGFNVPSTPATYTFTLEAKDNTEAVSTTTIGYEVKEPTILIVDDKPQANVLDEIDEDNFYAKIFEGYAYTTWDISEKGSAPTAVDLAAYKIAVVYSGSGSALWRGIGSDYPESSVPLADFVDGGGKIWVMGQGIMEDIDRGHDNPPDASEFEAKYLHLASATGDTLIDPTLKWARAGDFSGDLKFSFADNVIGDPVNFPRITMNVQSGDVEKIFAGDGAEIIYGGKSGLGDVLGDVGLRFPAGGTNTQVVFLTFPLFETASVKASLLNTRALAQEIMREMGQ